MVEILAQMEIYGVKIDNKFFKKLSDKFSKKNRTIRKRYF